MQDDTLLTLQEVARQTGFSEKTIRRWVKSGELPSLEIGGRFRIRRSDLQKFLDQHQKHPQDKDQKGE